MFDTCWENVSLTKWVSVKEDDEDEATRTPTTPVMEQWALAALLEDNCHTIGAQVLQRSPARRSFGPMSPVLRCWTIRPDSMLGGLDSRSWKVPRMTQNQQNPSKSWRIIWPRLKGERFFFRLDLFLLQDTELDPNPNSNSMRCVWKKTTSWVRNSELRPRLTDNFRMDLKIHAQS